MPSKFAIGPALILAASSALLAQFPPELSTCPAGVQADGFVDWTKLPTAPTTGSITATIPVSGVPNLSATFQITGTSLGNIYTANNATDLKLFAGVNPLITFSSPVQGVSVTFQTYGRFGHDFKMTAYSSTNEIGETVPGTPPAQVDSNAWDYPVAQPSASQLEIRSTSANIVAVSIQFGGDLGEYQNYDLINLRIESGKGPDPAAQVPRNGLREWLRADTVGISALPGLNLLSVWPDQSGKGSDAVPLASSVPINVISSGSTCVPVVSFGQPGPTAASFNLPINGWTGMTVFLVSQAFFDAPGWYAGQPLFWGETQPWGTTFVSPSQTGAYFRFGTGQVGNQPIYTRPIDFGGDLTVTTAIHDGGTDSLYVNGLLVLKQAGKQAAIAGTVPTATIGAGLNNTYFTGNIGEILIYDRALGADEREIVEHYLAAKYGVH